jgi:putative heme iron utilization protein
MDKHITGTGVFLSPTRMDAAFSATDTARRVMRVAASGALGTLGADGAPFASLVTAATTPKGEPLLLLSDIAVHAKNLQRDARVSLLLVEPGGESGDPLAGARLSITGMIAVDTDENHRRRFLARHPEAARYASFRDFRLYRIAVSEGHLVAGFGRIVDLKAPELLTDCSDCAALIDAERGAIEHMNKDHAEALGLYATRLLGLPDGDWITTGADPEGLDLRAGTMRARLPFPEKVHNAGELRAILVQLVKEARAAAPA